MSQTLAITGASGFLGRHLTAECLRLRSFRLRLLARDESHLSQFSNERTIICEGDLLRLASLKNFLERDTTIINLAYITNNEEENIKATLNLIKLAKQFNVKRVVHCSTAVVVGFKAKGIITESTEPHPQGIYQKTKYRIEEILRCQLPPSIELAILRPTEVIGPGGIGLQSMIQRLRLGDSLENLMYHVILKSRRFNYVSVYNVVAALILLATTSTEQSGNIYYISDDDDDNNNYESVEKIIFSHFGHNSICKYDIGLSQSFLSLLFMLLPSHSPPFREYSYSKISTLGYRKVVTLREAIENLLNPVGNNADS